VQKWHRSHLLIGKSLPPPPASHTRRAKERYKFVSQLQVTESGSQHHLCARERGRKQFSTTTALEKGQSIGLRRPAPLAAAELKRSGKWWVSCGGAESAAAATRPKLASTHSHTNRITPELALHTLSRRTVMQLLLWRSRTF
jgi:hypothetical protein